MTHSIHTGYLIKGRSNLCSFYNLYQVVTIEEWNRNN